MKKSVCIALSAVVLLAIIVSIPLTILAAHLKTPKITSIKNETYGIRIDWDDIKNADGYRVYKRGAGEKYWTYLETVTVSEYLDKNVKSGNYYRYTLRATHEDTFSDYDREGKYIKRLVNPFSIKAVNKTDGIEVSWAKINGALGYHVYRRGAGESWSYLKTVTNNSYSDNTVSNGKYYRYTVKAACGKHVSSFYPEGALTKRLENPTSIKTTNRGNGVIVTWDNVEGSNCYRVYRRGAGEKYWTYLKTVTSTYFIDTKTEKNNYYRYTVRAVCGKVFSHYSSAGSLIKFSDPIFKAMINTSTAESYTSLNQNLVDLVNLYPDILKLSSIGTSEYGNSIPLITMGNGDKKALIIGAIHAREHITTKYILRCIEDYCFAAVSESGKLGRYNVNDLLSQYTVYIVPCSNPDGLEIVRARLNPNITVTKLDEYKANYNGVDLNRNFPIAWEQINNGKTAPSECFFKGYIAASESETQALMTLCENNDFDFMLSIHIKGNCLFWGDTYNTAYNAQYKAFAKDIARACSFYMPNPTTDPTSYGGGFENWFRHTYNRPGVCIELSDSTNKIQPCDDVNYIDFNTFVNYNSSKYALAAALTSDNK